MTRDLTKPQKEGGLACDRLGLQIQQGLVIELEKGKQGVWFEERLGGRVVILRMSELRIFHML